jgi:hemoglobin
VTADAEPTPYDLMGGHDTFVSLVAAFYAGVAQDPQLRSMYPDADLGPAQLRLQLFLEQYWGGPRTYSDERGHPRLRMRHAPFPVTTEARDRWLLHMRRALDTIDLAPDQRDRLWSYLEMAAHSMVNSPQPE